VVDGIDLILPVEEVRRLEGGQTILPISRYGREVLHSRKEGALRSCVDLASLDEENRVFFSLEARRK
jgi:hypothetical protein